MLQSLNINSENRIKKRKVYTSNSNNIESAKKNVSWANISDETEEKKRLRTTPFPESNKRRKINNSTPIALTFDDSSDSDPYISSSGEDMFLRSDTSRFSNTTFNLIKHSRSNSLNFPWKITNYNDEQARSTNAVKWKETNLLLEPEYDSTLSDSYEYTESESSSSSNRDSSERSEFLFDANRKLTQRILNRLHKIHGSQDCTSTSEEVTDDNSDLDCSEPSESQNSYESESVINSTDEMDTDALDTTVNSGNSESLTYTLFNSTDILTDTDSNLSNSSIEHCFNFVKLNKESCKITEVPATAENQRKNLVKKKETYFKYSSSDSEDENLADSANFKNSVEVEINNISVSEVGENITEAEKDNTPDTEVAITEANEGKLTNTEIDKPDHEIFPKNLQALIRYRIFENECILILKHPLKLYFRGKLNISVLSGAVEILGYELKHENGNAIDVYCPRGNCYLCIETLGSRRNQELTNLLKTYNVSSKEIEELCSDMKETDSVLLVKDIQNLMIQYLNRHVAQHLFPKIERDCNRPCTDLETKLQCSFENQSESWKMYRQHNEWDTIVHDILHSNKELGSRTLLSGGKSVGKSVLLRYTINRLLNDLDKVVCIDLDIGQSEFTIPGCVSVSVIDKPIFGPNYTHITKPVKSFFVGSVNIMQCLERYIACVTSLLTFCQENIDKNAPWIINCMGITKSLGPDIIVSIIKLVAPALVIQIESDKDHRNFSSQLDMDFVRNYKSVLCDNKNNIDLEYKIKVIDSVAEEIVAGEWQTEPRYLRETCILSYFSQMLSDSITDITALPPYMASLSAIKLYHINYSDLNVPAVINGNIVALCNENSNETNEMPECYGFGIVRGIDLLNKEIYLLTPLTEEELNKVRSLHMGTITLPPSIYMTSGQHEGLVPFISLGIREGTSVTPKRCYLSAQKVLIQKKK